VRGILYLVLSTIGGALGWWLGSRLGVFGAFFLSLIGTAAGVYFATRISRYFAG
jgi:hypothetical protein